MIQIKSSFFKFAFFSTGGNSCPANPSRNPSSASTPYYGTLFHFSNTITASGSTLVHLMLPCKFTSIHMHAPLNFVIFYWLLHFSDPTSHKGLSYAGRGSRTLFDGRNGGRWITVNAYLFTAKYSDHSDVEFRCNPEFGYSDAHTQASKFATALGRIPEVFRSRVDIFDLNKGSYALTRDTLHLYVFNMK